jgi:hypothetical protein
MPAAAAIGNSACAGVPLAQLAQGLADDLEVARHGVLRDA